MFENHKKKILVVDDDPDMLRLLSARLKANEYDVAFATDGVSCMAELRKQDPDLLILDLGLPAGDGFKTLERVRDLPQYSGLPVVVLTAKDASEVRQKSMDAGADAFCQKGASQEELLSEVWRLLDRGEAPPQ